jgi:hypothetical protein
LADKFRTVRSPDFSNIDPKNTDNGAVTMVKKGSAFDSGTDSDVASNMSVLMDGVKSAKKFGGVVTPNTELKFAKERAKDDSSKTQSKGDAPFFKHTITGKQ